MRMEAAGDASTWAASGLLKAGVLRTAGRMAGASAARRRTAPSQLAATRGFAWGTAGEGDASTLAAPRLLRAEAPRTARRMAGVGAAKRRTAPSQLKAARGFAWFTAGEGDASTWAAPRLLLVEAHPTARRTAGASDARRRTAPSQLEATRAFAWRMEAAGDASTWAVPRLLDLEALPTA